MTDLHPGGRAPRRGEEFKALLSLEGLQDHRDLRAGWGEDGAVQLSSKVGFCVREVYIEFLMVVTPLLAENLIPA